MAVLQAEGRRFGLVVDRVLNTEEVVVKPLTSRFKDIGVYAGATLLGFGFVIIFIYLAIALRWGQRSEPNPWQSKGYEWLTPSPPPTHNFDSIPHKSQKKTAIFGRERGWAGR